MFKIILPILLLLLFSACTPAGDDPQTDANSTELNDPDISSHPDQDDDSDGDVQPDDTNDTEPTETADACESKILYAFLNDPDRGPVLVFTLHDFFSDQKTLNDYQLLFVDQNDTVTITDINDTVVSDDAWLINGYTNEKNEMCLHTGYFINQNDYIQYQHNYCLNSQGEWYRDVSVHIPLENGIWASIDDSQDYFATLKNEIFSFLEKESGYPSFDDLNISLFGQNLQEGFQIYSTALYAYYRQGELNDDILIGINYLSNDTNISDRLDQSVFFSLTHKDGKWEYQELLHSSNLTDAGSNDYLLVNTVSTPQGYSMLLEYRINFYEDNQTKHLYYIDRNETGDIELRPSNEVFGQNFETVAWKYLPNYYETLQRQTPHIAVDKLGRYHYVETQVEMINLSHGKRRYYYNIYDPSSATPEVPVIHQYIGGCPLPQ